MSVSKLKVWFAYFLQHEVPVDGFAPPLRGDERKNDSPASLDEPAKQVADRAGDYPHAPVRWGNFR